MKEKLMEVSCDPICGFMMRSHDEKELKRFVAEHAKSMHNMKVSGKDIESKMVSV